MTEVAKFGTTLPENLVINGGMDFWQRGTTFTSLAAFNYCADRFKYNKSGTGAVHDVYQDTDVPDDAISKYSLAVEVTTADGTMDAADFINIAHGIEGYNLRKVWGTYGCLSFWVSSPKTGVHTVTFTNSTDRSYIAEYEVDVADTWQYITVPVNFMDLTGTWDLDNGLGVWIVWVLGGGANFQDSTSEEWLTNTNFVATSQVNTADQIGNTFKICDVMFTPGSVPSRFVRAGRDFAGELKKCQRFYEKSYDLDDDPGTSVGTASTIRRTTAGDATSNYKDFSQPFKIVKRTASPTVNTYDPGGTLGNMSRRVDSTSSWSSFAAPGITTTQNNFSFNTILSDTVALALMYTAEDEF
jgi:hypothetical protein